MLQPTAEDGGRRKQALSDEQPARRFIPNAFLLQLNRTKENFAKALGIMWLFVFLFFFTCVCALNGGELY